MKTLLTSLIIAGGALLPATQIQAAPASKDVSFAAKAKSFGDFAPGKTFTLVVTEVVSAKAGLDGVNKKSSIPSGVPKFKKGQKVKFTIGSKGELKGPGFSIAYQGTSTVSNVYVNKPKKGAAVKADTATVLKDSLKQPGGAVLSFFKTSGSGMKTTVNSVNYVLD